MYCTRKITDSVVWLGAHDRRLALFENLFPIPRGVSYNSYLILDEKTCLVDTVDAAVMDRFTDNVAHTLGDRDLDYLVINHMEPDHCSAIESIMARYPSVKLVGNAKTYAFVQQFYDLELEDRFIEVADGDTLELGSHTLTFYLAPMVHWPEVMMTYDAADKILFSADAFGSFGSLDGALFNDEVNFERDWLSDARRYYANIVGKFGRQVLAVMKKVSVLDIQMICPLHGVVWRSNLDWILSKYRAWSSYEPEDQAVAVFYGSMYGDLEEAADILSTRLHESGVHDVVVYDVSSTDISEVIGEVWRCSHIVLIAPTYNMGIYPSMAYVLHDMKALNVQNRTVGIIGSGTWSPCSAKLMRAEVECMKDITVLEPVVTVLSAVKAEERLEIEQLADAIVASMSQSTEA